MALFFVSSLLSFSKLTIMAVSGAALYFLVCMAGIRVSAIMYAAALILGFLLLPNKLVILTYAFCFGPYALIKPGIEHIRGYQRGKRGSGKFSGIDVLIWALKLICAAALVGAGFAVFKAAFLAEVDRITSVSVWLLVIVLIALFVVYDYILTLIGVIARQRFAKWRS